jgi:hypothetical protein
MAGELFQNITVQGLYDDQTGNPLFGVIGTPLYAGSPATASGVIIVGVDTNGNIQTLSMTPDGFLNVNATFSGTTVVDGSLSNNTAIPAATNLGVLPAVAASSYTTVSYANGNQVLLVTDLHGAINNDMQAVAGVQLGATGVTAFGTAPAAVNVQGVNASIFSGTTPITSTGGALNTNVTNTVTVTGTVAATQSGAWTVDLTNATFTVAGSPAVSSLNVFVEGGSIGVTGTVAATQSGTWTVQQGGAPWSVTISGQPISVTQSGTWTVTAKGEYTNNTTATSTITDQFAVLPAIASTAYATNTWANGNQVVLVTDLHGAINNDMQAVAGVAIGPTSVTNFGTAPAAAPVQAVNASIFAGTTGITATGTSLNVNVTNPSAPFTVVGTLTNNNAAPGANNLGVLGFIATATPEAYTQGDQVLATTSLGGAIRIVPVDEANAASLSYFSYDSSNAYKVCTSGVPKALWSIQANSAAIIFLLRELEWFTDGSVSQFQLIKNATLTGSSFAALAGTHVKVDTAGTYTATSGTVVMSGYVGSTPRSYDSLLTAMASGAPGDTFTMVATGFAKTSAVAQIRWSEQAAAL